MRHSFVSQSAIPHFNVSILVLMDQELKHRVSVGYDPAQASVSILVLMDQELKPVYLEGR